MKLRPEVRLFAEMMELTLREHDNEKGINGWKATSPYELLGWLDVEKMELVEALAKHRKMVGEVGAWPNMPPTAKRAKEGVLREACDIANFAMMIADVIGGLHLVPKPPGSEQLEKIQIGRDWPLFHINVEGERGVGKTYLTTKTLVPALQAMGVQVYVNDAGEVTYYPSTKLEGRLYFKERPACVLIHIYNA